MRSETAWTTRPPRAGAEEGMALITVIMVMMLVSVLMVGFVSAIVADNRSSGLDHDQTQAYAATHAGLEKLTSDLSGLFVSDFSPSPTQINALLVSPPTVPGFQYLDPDGSSGYKITWDFVDANGNPAPDPSTTGTITHGPYQGFRGLITPYNITVTARSNGGAEVRMKRTLQTIAVPVFQFGMFSENDLSFHAGANFNFGGRVHTNANLYLAEGNGVTLTLSDRITAVGEIIRTNLSNGWATNANYTGTVRVPTTIMANPVNNLYRALARTEGSLVGTAGSAPNVGPPTWTDLSVGTYTSNIRNGLTGAKRLDLPLVSQGAVPVDLIRRPAQNSNENVTALLIYQQRYFSQAALRILLSDTAADITNLPTVIAATPPVPLDGSATAAQLTVDATHPPIATSPGPLAAPLVTSANAAAGANALSAVIPPALRAGLVRVNGLPAAGVLCTGRTATSFRVCAAGLPAAANGSTVSTTINGATVSTTLTAALGAANAAIMNVVSTAGFAPGLFWVNLAAPAAPLMVTCAGNNDAATQFTTCAGITAAVPAGTTISTNALSNAGTSLINGFIKIEKKDAAGVWSDVTTEILNLGIASKNQWPVPCAGADPNPTAIIRLQRMRDNADGNCAYYRNSLNSNDYWPNALYDTREGLQRDSTPIASTAIALGGVVHFVELDVSNLRRWFAGTIGATGNQAKNDNGYIVYFSDRRNNRNPTAAQCGAVAAPCESGEYGFEDVVNRADVNGVPDNILEPAGGEDSGGLDANGKPMIGGNGLLETYGQTPQNLPPGAALPLTAAARPQSTVTAAHALVNRAILFRRALKLVNGGIVGGLSSLPPGLTVAAENPVYVQGNYNATANLVATEVHVPAAILGDAVTMLSTSWRDVQSFRAPNDPGSRGAVTTGYRVAIVSGKNPTFPQPQAWASDQDFGTDGGAHNFLRYLENWGGATLNYRGSIVSFYFSRQAVGVYKCCTNVYGAPTRGYTFDTDFLIPALLPPGTPMFRDINTLTFRQLLRPNQ